MLLLGGLLFLRVPFLGGLGLFYAGKSPDWLMMIFENGTYLLTALLMWTERERLMDHHMGKGALAIFIFGPILEPVVYRLSALFSPMRFNPSPRWFQIAVGILLLAALILSRTRIEKIRNNWLKELLIAIGLGVATGLIFGFISAKFQNAGGGGKEPLSLVMIFMAIVTQTSRAAVYEEPLFRGFLWGFLKKAGWRDVGIWLFQAGLFMISHIYYIKRFPFSFWVIVPIGGLVIGYAAWRSRSIANSMITHGIGNALGGILRQVL